MNYCPLCGTENKDGAQFCKRCGAFLTEPTSIDAPVSGQSSDKNIAKENPSDDAMVTCLKCQAVNKRRARFCKNCGADLTTPVTADIRQPKTETPASSQAEDLRKIEFLLEELETSQKEGLIPEDAYRTLKSKYIYRINGIKADGYLKQAVSMCKDNRWDEAVGLAGQAVAIDPNLVQAYLIMSRAYERRGKFKDAEYMCRKALAIDADNELAGKLLQEIMQKTAAEKAGTKEEPEPKPVPQTQVTPPEPPPTQPVSTPPQQPTIAPAPPVPPETPPFDLKDFFGPFFEKYGLKWWYTIGAFIFLAGVIGLITWSRSSPQHWSLIGKYTVFGLLFFSTIGFYLLGNLMINRLRIGGLIMISVASLLVPMNFYVFNRYRIFGTLYPWDYVGVIAAFTCAIIYLATTIWLKESYFVYFTSAAVVLLLHFVLQVFNAPYVSYGLFFIPLAGVYMLFAYYFKRMDQKKYSLPLFIMANALSGVFLAATLFKPGFFFETGLNNTTVMLLMTSIIYLISAYLYGSNTFVYISSILILLFGFVFFYKGGLDWHRYGLYFMLFGCFFLGMGATNRSLKKQDFATNYFIIGLIVSTVVMLVFFGKDIVTGLWGNLYKARTSELVSTLITTFLGALIYSAVAYFLRKKVLIYLASVIYIYVFFVILAIARINFAYHPFYLATILCPLFLLAGWFVRRQSSKEYGQPLFIVGYSVAGISALMATYAYLAYWYMPRVIAKTIYLSNQAGNPAVRFGTMWTMIALAAICLLSAYFYKHALFEYPGLLSGLFAYGILASYLASSVDSNIFLITERNYGVYFLPLIGAIAVAGFMLDKIGAPKFAEPLLRTALYSTVGFLALQQYYLAVGFRFSVSTATLACAVFFLVSAIVFGDRDIPLIEAPKRIPYVYGSSALFIFGLSHLLYNLHVSYSYIGLTLVLIGLLWALIGYSLKKLDLKEWVNPAMNSAVAIGAVGVIFTYLRMTPWNPLTLSFFAFLYTFVVTQLEQEDAALISVLVFLFASGNLQGIPAGRYSYYTSLFTAYELVLVACFAWMAYKFKSQLLSYAASIMLSVTVISGMSIWLHGTIHPAYYFAGLVLFCPVLLIAGWIIERTSRRELAQAPYLVGYFISFICIMMTASFYLMGLGQGALKSYLVERNIAILAASLGTLIYAVSSYVGRRWEFVYPASMAAIIAYVLGGSATFMPYFERVFRLEQNFGLYLLYLVAFMFLIGRVLETLKARGYSEPLNQVSLIVASYSLISQIYYITEWGFTWSVATTFLLSAMFFLIFAIVRRGELFGGSKISKAEVFSFFSSLTLIVFFFDFLNLMRVDWPHAFLFAGLLSAAYFAVSQVLLRFGQKFFERAYSLTSLGLLISVNITSLVMPGYPRLYLAPLSFVLLMLMAWLRDSKPVLYAALFLFAMTEAFSFLNNELLTGYPVFVTVLRTAGLCVVFATCAAMTVKFKRRELVYYGIAALVYGIYLGLRAAGAEGSFYPVYFIGVVAALIAMGYVLGRYLDEFYKNPVLISSILLGVLINLISGLMAFTYGPQRIRLFLIVLFVSTAVYVMFAIIAWFERSAFSSYIGSFVYGVMALSLLAQFELVQDRISIVDYYGTLAILAVVVTTLVLAWRFKRFEYTYYGLVLGVFGFYEGMRALGLPTRHYPAYYIWFVVTLLACGYFAKERWRWLFEVPCQAVAMSTILVTILVPISLEHRPVAIGVMVAYSLITACAAYLWRSLFYTYFASLTLTACYFYTLITWPRFLSWTIAGFAIACLSAFWLLVGMVLFKLDKRFGWPLLALSAAISTVAASVALMGAGIGHEPGSFAVYAMLLIGCIYVAAAVFLQQPLLGHVAFVAFLIAYYLPLLDNDIYVIDAYLIPVGLYLIGVGFINKYLVKEAPFSSILITAGTVTILGATFIPSLETRGVIHAILLMGESILFIFMGISLRMKSFLFLGTAFLLVNGLVQFWQPLTSLHWAYYATVTGILIIVSGIMFERKRIEILGRGQEIIETLREWS